MATTKYAAMPSLIKAVRTAKYGGSEQYHAWLKLHR